jgi:hypothetical protein
MTKHVESYVLVANLRSSEFIVAAVGSSNYFALVEELVSFIEWLEMDHSVKL